MLTAPTDLKNTSDDTIPVYLNSLKFKQSHRLTDVRLALGYSALILAAACFAWDYKLGFDITKYYTAAAVAVYAVLNSALTLWIWKKENGVVYVGTAPSGETVRIGSFSPSLPVPLDYRDRQTLNPPFAGNNRDLNPQEHPGVHPNHNHRTSQVQVLQARDHHHHPLLHRVVRRSRPLRTRALPDHAGDGDTCRRQAGPEAPTRHQHG